MERLRRFFRRSKATPYCPPLTLTGEALATTTAVDSLATFQQLQRDPTSRLAGLSHDLRAHYFTACYLRNEDIHYRLTQAGIFETGQFYLDDALANNVYWTDGKIVVALCKVNPRSRTCYVDMFIYSLQNRQIIQRATAQLMTAVNNGCYLPTVGMIFSNGNTIYWYNRKLHEQRLTDCTIDQCIVKDPETVLVYDQRRCQLIELHWSATEKQWTIGSRQQLTSNVATLAYAPNGDLVLVRTNDENSGLRISRQTSAGAVVVNDFAYPLLASDSTMQLIIDADDRYHLLINNRNRSRALVLDPVTGWWRHFETTSYFRKWIPGSQEVLAARCTAPGEIDTTVTLAIVRAS